MTHLLAFVSFCCDTAFWLGWSGLILMLIKPVSDLTPVIPLIGLGALAADWLCEIRASLRWLGLLPAAAALLLCRRPMDYLAVLPPIFYLGLCIQRGTLLPDESALYYRFPVRTGAAILCCIFCIMGDRSWCFRCAIVSLAASVFLTRMRRHSREDLRSPRLFALEAALLAGTCALCLVLSSQTMLSAGLTVLKTAMHYLAVPLLNLAMMVLYVIVTCLTWLLSWILPADGEISLPQSMQMGGQMEPFLPVPEAAEENPLVKMIAAAIGILIFLTIARYVFRYFQSGQRLRTEQTRTPDDFAEAALEPNAQALPGPLDRSPEARIRRAYAAYCRSLNRRGKQIRRSDTSRSVNALAGLEQDPDAAELRRLYLLARYTRRAGLTQEDAHRAAVLSRRLRGKEE